MIFQGMRQDLKKCYFNALNLSFKNIITTGRLQCCGIENRTNMAHSCRQTKKEDRHGRGKREWNRLHNTLQYLKSVSTLRLCEEFYFRFTTAIKSSICVEKSKSLFLLSHKQILVDLYTLSTVVFLRHKCQPSFCVRQNY